MIPRNVRLSEAPSYGLTILEHDPGSPGALAYKELAEEVIERAEADVTSGTHTAASSAAAEPAQQQEQAGTAAGQGATSADTAEARIARLEQRVNHLAEELGELDTLGERVTRLEGKLAVALDSTERVVAFLGRVEEAEQVKKAAIT